MASLKPFITGNDSKCTHWYCPFIKQVMLDLTEFIRFNCIGISKIIGLLD